MDYAGNSDKSKEEKKPKTDLPEKVVEKVVTEEVIEKKRSLGSKVKGIFFGGEFKSASTYILADVLLPAARNAVVDAVTKGVENLVYGNSSQARTRRPEMGSRIQYNTTSRNRSVMIPDQPPHRRVSRRDANEFLLGNREDADLVLERMMDIVSKYEVVSLADALELMGRPSAHVDHKWGWTYLSNAEVRQVRDGYILELPPMEEI